MMFHRSCVAGPAIQTPLSRINSLFESVILCGNIFKTPSLPYQKHYGAKILRECSTPPTCHLSQVTRHVTRKMSCVTFFLEKVVKLFSRQSVINWATPFSFIMLTVKKKNPAYGRH